MWRPKYRRAALEGPIVDRLIALLREDAPALGSEIVELVLRPDHVPLVAHVPPTLSAAQIMHRFKGATSHTLSAVFPALRNRLPSLWTSSYDVGTTGQAACETIRRYIAAQKAV